MLDVIAGARRRLVLSLFRCNDGDVLAALAAARERGVKVDALLTRRAGGGKGGRRRLWATLEEIGVTVHRYRDPVVKYHAKYVVADGERALIATLNPTRKCFSRTWDFALTTNDRNVVRSLATLFALDAAGERLRPRHRMAPPLIVAPDGARDRVRALLGGARRSIRVLDHKLSDPEMVAVLRKRREKGLAVTVVGAGYEGALVPHGKLVIVDEHYAMLGSLALSKRSLDRSREVSIVTAAPACVRALLTFYERLAAEAGPGALVLPGDRAA